MLNVSYMISGATDNIDGRPHLGPHEHESWHFMLDELCSSACAVHHREDFSYLCDLNLLATEGSKRNVLRLRLNKRFRWMDGWMDVPATL